MLVRTKWFSPQNQKLWSSPPRPLVQCHTSMSLHVKTQMVWSGELSSTQMTFEWLLTWSRTKLEISKITEERVKYSWRCYKHFLTCMFSIMPCKLIRPSKLPGTSLPGALVRLLSRVCPVNVVFTISPPSTPTPSCKEAVLASGKIAVFNVAKNWTPVFQDFLEDKLCSLKRQNYNLEKFLIFLSKSKPSRYQLSINY